MGQGRGIAAWPAPAGAAAAVEAHPCRHGTRANCTHLFIRAPDLLEDQIALIGKDLRQPHDCIYITSNAPSGLLYLFVNDLWTTADNNSGGLRLSIERVDEPGGKGTLFTLQHRLEIRPDGKRDETNMWVRSIVHADAIDA
jgi:hypothetical protein